LVDKRRAIGFERQTSSYSLQNFALEGMAQLGEAVKNNAKA